MVEKVKYWLEVKYWLKELEEYDTESGRLDYEEREKELVKVISGLKGAVSKLENEDLKDLVYDLVELYENSGYYDYDGIEEKKMLRKQIKDFFK